MPQAGWTQSYPGGSGCHALAFTPTGMNSFFDVDFGSWLPVAVIACKEKDLDGQAGGDTVPVEGWLISLTREGEVLDTQPTGADGCYTWSDLTPGFAHDVRPELTVEAPGIEA